MGEIQWATFRRSERRWPRRCWPQSVVANKGHVSASSQVSKWSGIHRICAERVTESVWTEPEPPKSRQSSETRGGLSVSFRIESARVRDVWCGRTLSGGGRCWSLNHAGRAVACSHSGLTNHANGWPESRVPVPLDRVRATLSWLGRFQRLCHAPSPGSAVQKMARLGQNPFMLSSRWATCVCLYVQPTNGSPAIGSRTRATMANKWIAQRPRFSAHSDDKHSKDLLERPDRIHPDLRAAQREAVEVNALQ